MQVIVVGRLVKHIENYNNMSALRFYETKRKYPNYLQACGAITVSKRKVVTAAHCLDDEDDNYVALNFGPLNINYSNYEVNITRKQITIHKKYNICISVS